MSDFDIRNDVEPEEIPDPEEPTIADLDEEALLDDIDELDPEEGIEFDVKDVVDDTAFGDEDDET